MTCDSCRLCLETSVADVLNHHTVTPTTAWHTARMAEKDAPEDAPKDLDGPSLELPSFGFRRKKKPAPGPRPESAPEPTAVEAETPAPLVVEAPTADDTEAPAEPARRGRRRPVLPRLGAVPAALVTGLVAGLLTVGLVWGSQGACEIVRGTSSCGNAGFLLLLAVFVAVGWSGGALLRAFGVSEGGSTSFLAMGLVAVVLLLVLGEFLFAWWMVVAVPVVAMVAYVVAHRVSTAMVEPGGREMHR